MDNDEKDFLNKINRDKSADFSFLSNEVLNSVFNKVVNKTFRKNDGQKNSNQRNIKMNNMNSAPSNKADIVIQADRNVRESVQNLVVSLFELGDKDIALKLIGEHIIMLNEAFKEFEK